MHIQSLESGNTRVVSPAGSIDALTAGALSAFIANHAGRQQLVLDLAQVDFMSSAGLRVILATTKEARQHGGDLRIAAPQAGVLKTLKMAGFTSIVKTFDTVDEAVTSYL
jgi:anti-sigma B factor antagonist